MAILDLQKLETKKSEESSAPAGKSGASKGCTIGGGGGGGGSHLSLLLCR